MTTISRYEALREVRACFETEQAMADAFSVTQPTVWRWLNQSKQLPAEKVLLAEKLTGVSRHDLRPDIYPVDLPPAPERWTGVDQCTSARFVGTDHRAGYGNRQNGLDRAPRRQGASR
ncbi:transcriptional regulator [Novosphingobium sp. 9]|uniref:transcriptional regulator n=1 Tax=Novosphingobium sp. 9 TaxID=2025349 RepID=UPI0021B65D85|nr:helix-turn-helix domain-containing protein [Novosphingobium sp. 9]